MSCDVVASTTASPCNPGEGTYPPDIDCVGEWSSCNDCIKTYIVSTEQSGNGAECPLSDGLSSPCEPGEGSCPQQTGHLHLNKRRLLLPLKLKMNPNNLKMKIIQCYL